jgi:hypothetical protein
VFRYDPLYFQFIKSEYLRISATVHHYTLFILIITIMKSVMLDHKELVCTNPKTTSATVVEISSVTQSLTIDFSVSWVSLHLSVLFHLTVRIISWSDCGLTKPVNSPQKHVSANFTLIYETALT